MFIIVQTNPPDDWDDSRAIQWYEDQNHGYHVEIVSGSNLASSYEKLSLKFRYEPSYNGCDNQLESSETDPNNIM